MKKAASKGCLNSCWSERDVNEWGFECYSDFSAFDGVDDLADSFFYLHHMCPPSNSTFHLAHFVSRQMIWWIEEGV